MSSPEQADQVRVRFRSLFLDDRSRGEPRGLDAYLKLFQGFEDTVRSEYSRLDSAAPGFDTEETVVGHADTAPAARPAPRGAEGPESVGPYRIEKELGRGGMGVVYLAHDTRLEDRPESPRDCLGSSRAREGRPLPGRYCK